MRLLADLHVHSVLSACAEVEMIPPLLVARACEQGCGLLALTDHNAVGNCAAVMEAARGSALVFFPGMELQTQEEVHLLCLFDALEPAYAWQSIVWDRLPQRLNPEALFGPQFVVDAEGRHVATERRLLAASASITLDDAIAGVTALGGVAIPAHIDRPSFSLLANLGFVPRSLKAPALELFRNTEPAALIRTHPELTAWPLIHGSDAHRLADLSPGLRLEMDEPTIPSLVAALSRLPQMG